MEMLRAIASGLSARRLIALAVAAVLVFFLYSASTGSRRRAQEEADDEPDGPAERERLRLPGWVPDVRSLELQAMDPDLSIARGLALARGAQTVSEHTVEVEGCTVFYREALPVDQSPRQQVLLLHGVSFSSVVWQELGTLQLISACGHRGVAIDIPGAKEGRSKGTFSDPVRFLSSLLSRLGMEQVVLVSPSSSGSLSLPFLVTYPELLTGFVPIAPVSSGDYLGHYSHIKVPTVIVYGESDSGLGPTSVRHLSILPNSQAVVLLDAGHAAYHDQPDAWHVMLYNFLKKLG